MLMWESAVVVVGRGEGQVWEGLACGGQLAVPAHKHANTGCKWTPAVKATHEATVFHRGRLQWFSAVEVLFGASGKLDVLWI